MTAAEFAGVAGFIIALSGLIFHWLSANHQLSKVTTRSLDQFRESMHLDQHRLREDFLRRISELTQQNQKLIERVSKLEVYIDVQGTQIVQLEQSRHGGQHEPQASSVDQRSEE